jgi:phage gp29-like protein
MKLLTLDLTERQQQLQAATQDTTGKSTPSAPVDEWGRNSSPASRPLLGPSFQQRVRDRLSAITPPWSPEQIANALKAAEQGDMRAQAELLEHMEERDGELAGYMLTRRLAPCGVRWSIDPANDSTEALRVADMVRAEVKGIPNFEHAFRDMQDAIGKSIAALWMDWQPGGRTPDTTHRIEGLHYISAKRYKFHWREERFLILPDEAPLNAAGAAGISAGANIGVEPPPWKVVLHRSRTRTTHPAKGGCLRIVVFDFMLRNYSKKDFAVFCEIFGMPLRLGKYPDGASEEDKAELAAALEHLGTDSMAIVSKLVEIDYLEWKGSNATIPYTELHKLCGRNMQFAILGQDQTNTHNDAGGRTQVEFGGAPIRQDILEADCIDTQATWTRQVCYPIVGFSNLERPYVDQNTGRIVWPIADSLCPKLKLHYEPEHDYESMIAVDVPLLTVLRIPQTKGQIAKRYGRELPEGVNPDELVEVAAPQPQQVDAGSNGNGRNRSFARELTDNLTFSTVRGERAQATLDAFGDRGVAAATDALAQLTTPLRRMILHEASSLEDVERRLRKAFDDLDASELETLVRRGTFVARLHGMESAHREVPK